MLTKSRLLMFSASCFACGILIGIVLFSGTSAFAAVLYTQPVHSTSMGYGHTVMNNDYVLRVCAVPSAGTVSSVDWYPGDGIKAGTVVGVTITRFATMADCHALSGGTGLGSISAGSGFSNGTLVSTSISSIAPSVDGTQALLVDIQQTGGTNCDSGGSFLCGTYGTTGMASSTGNYDDNAFLNLYDGAGSSTATRFVSLSPAGGATVASSSAVSVGGILYISSADFTSGMVARLKIAPFANYQLSSGVNPDSLYTSYDVTLSSGTNSFSHAFDLSLGIGNYSYTVDVVRPADTITSVANFFGLGSFFGASYLISTTSSFIVGYNSPYDSYVASTTAILESAYASSSVGDCLAFSSAGLASCIRALFIPDVKRTADVLKAFRDNFLTYVPMGYVTRFFTIVSGTATSTLPSYILTIPNGYPGGGQSLNLTPWGHILGTGSILDTATSSNGGYTFRQATEGYWDTFVYIIFAFAVVSLVMGLRGLTL